jgi:SAM-dependent methyltransferase
METSNKKRKVTAGSILRMLQYRELDRLSISGKVLDLGGSTHAGYQEFIQKGSSIDTINIDSKTGANIIANVEESLPIENTSYDIVLAINLLEHVYKVSNVFVETSRVLKVGGQFIIAVPFFHHVHASPDDYHRYTNSCLRRMCEDVNLEVLEIKELGGGVFSTVFQMIGGAIRPRFLRDIIKNLCHTTDTFLASISNGYKRIRKNNPLGYLVIAKKKK